MLERERIANLLSHDCSFSPNIRHTVSNQGEQFDNDFQKKLKCQRDCLKMQKSAAKS